MLTGHEEEFRRLFADEAERRLDALVAAALELERGAADAERVRAMFRDAHTLKGSAGVVGFTGVAAALHALEHELDDLRAGRRAADPAMADEVLRPSTPFAR
jgi:two-component system chemotaxis sensor kinase CheA